MMAEAPHEIRFQEIPAGEFRMGGSDEDKFVSAVELPARQVRVAAFSISVHPVTIHQWNQHGEGSIDGHPNWPVTRVSFDEAQAFAASLNARLPSEAEWEYACRAGSDRIFPQGGNLHPDDANFLYDESGEPVGRGGLSPVGFHPSNSFGLHDMIGNVCEWTADLWHPHYQNAPADSSPWLDDGHPMRRVIRGGGWDHLPRLLRASWRDWAPESARWDNLGFRLARDSSR
jgi:formylglycine-generating enzyme required for sulfatase activity